MRKQTTVIFQSVLLKTAANLTAQLARQWGTTNPAQQVIDWKSVAEFAIFGLIQCHLNCHWQQFLENTFPSRTACNTIHPPRKDSQTRAEKPSTNPVGETKTAWHNITFKLALDQTVGLFLMNSVFLVCTNAVRLQNAGLIVTEVNQKIWRLIMNAWKIWPACALCNFLWVPVESRVLVASCVGFGWNVFLTFYTITHSEGANAEGI